MKTTKASVFYKVPKIRVRCISGHTVSESAMDALFMKSEFYL